LLEAYRRLESAANRPAKTPEQTRAFESAVADIQLLGTPKQVETTIKYVKQHAAGSGAQLDDVLRVLRKDLRQETELSGEVENAVVFRFSDNK
jgi:intergrase/recombinase